MFIATLKTFFGQQINGSNNTQPTTTPPFARRIAPPCRPFHELPLFRDARSTSDPTEVSKVIPLAAGLGAAPACERPLRDMLATFVEPDAYKTLTTEMTETDSARFNSPPVSRSYVGLVEMDVDYIHALFDRLSVEMDEREAEVKLTLPQNPRVYEFNDAGEFVLPTKTTTNFFVPSEAGCSSFSSVSGTPSLVTVPFSSPRLPSSPVGPNTPSPPLYPTNPLFSGPPFKPTSSHSLLHIIDYPEDAVSTSLGSPIDTYLDDEGSNSFSTSDLIPSTASRCMDIEDAASFHQRRFATTSSHTFGGPGDFDESCEPIQSLSLPSAGFDICPTAEPTPSRFSAGSSQTFGNPGSQQRYEDAVLDDSPQPPSTSAFGCAVRTSESQNSISISSRSPADGEHRTIGVENFRIKKILGSGAFGDVYLTKHRAHGTLHAMKVIPKSKTSHPEAMMFLLNESKIMRRLADAKSSFVVNLEASFSDSRNYYFVMNFFPGGDLEDLIHSRNEPFDMVTLKSYTKDLVQGLTFLRKNRVIHRDIKPANIFIDARGHLVLGDYGLARIFETGNPMFEHPEFATMNEDDWGALTYCEVTDMTDSTCGSLGYMAPEIILRDPYSALVDIWSLGATFYEMTFGMVPFPGDSREELMAATVYMNLEFPGQNDRWPIDEELKDLIQKMLVKQQRDRIRLQAIVNHPYFDDVDWDLVASRGRESDATSDDHDDGELQLDAGEGVTRESLYHESGFSYISPRWRHEKFVQSTPTSGGGEYPCCEVQTSSRETRHDVVYLTCRCENRATAPTLSCADGGPDSEAQFTEIITQLYPSRPPNPLYRTSTFTTPSLRPPSPNRNAPEPNGKLHQPEGPDCLDLGHVVNSGTDRHSKCAPPLHVRSEPKLGIMSEKLPPVIKSYSVVIGDKNGARTVRSVSSMGLEQFAHPPLSSIKPTTSQPLVGNESVDELRSHMPAEDGMSCQGAVVIGSPAPILLAGSRLSVSSVGGSTGLAAVPHGEHDGAIPGAVVYGSRRGSSLFFFGDDDISAQSSPTSTGILVQIWDPIVDPSTPLEKRNLSSSIAENRTLVDTDIQEANWARSPGMKTGARLEVSSWADSSYTRCGSGSPAPSIDHAAELEGNPQKLIVNASSVKQSVPSTMQGKPHRALVKILKSGVRATKTVFKGVARIRSRRS